MSEFYTPTLMVESYYQHPQYDGHEDNNVVPVAGMVFESLMKCDEANRIQLAGGLSQIDNYVLTETPGHKLPQGMKDGTLKMADAFITIANGEEYNLRTSK